MGLFKEYNKIESEMAEAKERQRKISKKIKDEFYSKEVLQLLKDTQVEDIIKKNIKKLPENEAIITIEPYFGEYDMYFCYAKNGDWDDDLLESFFPYVHDFIEDNEDYMNNFAKYGVDLGIKFSHIKGELVILKEKDS